jgi:hypothetical protein
VALAVDRAPIADLAFAVAQFPDSTLNGHSLALLDDLVGAGEDRWRHREAECLRSLEIDG